MDTAIESDCTCKVYRGHVPGVTGLTFKVAAGEVFGLLGPGGAGKTTALRLLAGQLRPTAGRLSVCGLDVLRESVAARRRVAVALDRWPLDAARWLQDRPVVVVDEPALADCESRTGSPAATLVDLAHGEGRAVVVATRRLAVARQLCDRVAVMRSGRMLDPRPAALLAPGPAAGQWWEIRVQGHLPGGWSDWFDGLSLTAEDDGTLLLSGSLADQAALHGVLARIRDLGLPLRSVTSREAFYQEEASESW